MNRRNDRGSNGPGRLRRAANAVSNVFRRSRKEEPDPAAFSGPDGTSGRTEPDRAVPRRPVQRPTDIPMDVLDRSYNPPRTSSKASFRSDGADHQYDQEFALGVADDRWRTEDRYTNKSGDPRIGTRGRTYDAADEERNRNE